MIKVAKIIRVIALSLLLLLILLGCNVHYPVKIDAIEGAVEQINSFILTHLPIYFSVLLILVIIFSVCWIISLGCKTAEEEESIKHIDSRIRVLENRVAEDYEKYTEKVQKLSCQLPNEKAELINRMNHCDYRVLSSLERTKNIYRKGLGRYRDSTRAIYNIVSQSQYPVVNQIDEVLKDYLALTNNPPR